MSRRLGEHSAGPDELCIPALIPCEIPLIVRLIPDLVLPSWLVSCIYHMAITYIHSITRPLEDLIVIGSGSRIRKNKKKKRDVKGYLCDELGQTLPPPLTYTLGHSACRETYTPQLGGLQNRQHQRKSLIHISSYLSIAWATCYKARPHAAIKQGIFLQFCGVLSITDHCRYLHHMYKSMASQLLLNSPVIFIVAMAIRTN